MPCHRVSTKCVAPRIRHGVLPPAHFVTTDVVAIETDVVAIEAGLSIEGGTEG